MTIKKTAFKLISSFLFMVGAFIGLRITHIDGFFFAFIVGFIFTLLYSFDLGELVRDSEKRSLVRRIVGIALGVPQAIFGLISIAVGGSIICWVLYNTFIERLPGYSGGILALGFGPAFVAFGAFWLNLAFRRAPPIVEQDGANEEPHQGASMKGDD